MAKVIQEPQQLNIEISDEIAEGIYSNLAVISHSTTEFIIDYVRMLPNTPQARVKSRIILTPEHAKRLLIALAENVRRYETQYGEIQERDQPAFPMTFSGPTAQA